MPNTRKGGRSNTTQNLDNATPDMNQNLDQGASTDDRQNDSKVSRGQNTRSENDFDNESKVSGDQSLDGTISGRRSRS